MLLQARSFRQMKLRDEYTCPLELIHDMIKGKWKPIILWRLRLGATSLSKLENDADVEKRAKIEKAKLDSFARLTNKVSQL